LLELQRETLQVTRETSVTVCAGVNHSRLMIKHHHPVLKRPTTPQKQQPVWLHTSKTSFQADLLSEQLGTLDGNQSFLFLFWWGIKNDLFSISLLASDTGNRADNRLLLRCPTKKHA